MQYSSFGSKDGRLVVYFHGAPGSVSECAVFDLPAKTHGLRVICFDRFTLDCGNDEKRYYERIALEVSELLGKNETLDIIGFSIGAFVALEVSARLGDRVKNIHLVSAAAPLGSGDYVEKMAGAFVFKLADRHSFIFYLLTQYQKLMAFLAPKVLFKLLFSSARGGDLDLSRDEKFQEFIIPILKNCFRNESSGYMRDVKSYVKWDNDLNWCLAKTTNWHGTSDNWSPFAMASQLQSAIQGAVGLEPLEGMSHYSCLIQAAPKIMAQLSNE
ncbi:MAG: pimeloyl-ACP methyl ester carboxylesterase [Oceanicoccus sp.]|jgi:pimeloyl-ACP methyl ester carboxylesterase